MIQIFLSDLQLVQVFVFIIIFFVAECLPSDLETFVIQVNNCQFLKDLFMRSPHLTSSLSSIITVYDVTLSSQLREVIFELHKNWSQFEDKFLMIHVLLLSILESKLLIFNIKIYFYFSRNMENRIKLKFGHS